MTTRLGVALGQGRPELVEKPRLFDDLGLVALPTAVTCARIFTQYTLTKWGASSFVVADAVTIASELVDVAVQETGILDDVVVWSELDYVNRIVVRLLGFPKHVVIEVWDAASEPMVLPADEPNPELRGLHLVDVTATRWASTASVRGRLTWAEVGVYERTASGLPVRPSRPASPPGPPPATLSEGLLRRVREGLNRL
jgi:hypothetical protein